MTGKMSKQNCVLKTSKPSYSLDMINIRITKTFVFNMIVIISSLLLVSLVNTVMAQQQDSISLSNSFNNSSQGANTTTISKD
jgi:hypothetical protein